MNIIVGSKFNPFSYAELTAPMRDYRLEYKEAEALYSDLISLTEAWADIANRVKSPEAYEMYRRYSDKLLNLSNDFARGMTASNRAALLGLKRDYAKEIIPILKASEAMKEALKYRDALRALDNSVLFEEDDFSVDDFLHGKTIGNRYVSGKDIMSNVAIAADALSKEYRKNPLALKDLLKGNDDYFEYIKEYGFSSDAILSAIARDSNASKILTSIVDNAIKASGIDKWKGVLNENGKYTNKGQLLINLLRSYGNQGLWKAVGTALAQLVDNWRERERVSNAYASSRLRLAHEWEMNEIEARSNAAIALAEAKKANKGSGASYDVRNKETVVVGAKTGKRYTLADTLTGIRQLNSKEMIGLVNADGTITNEFIRNVIGSKGDFDDYMIEVIPAKTEYDKSGYVWDDNFDEDVYIITPRESKRSATEDTDIIVNDEPE